MDSGGAKTNALAVLRYLPNDLGHPRIGFSAGRRLGSAVKRNRAKRLLRDSVRRLPLTGSWDIAIIARASAAPADYAAVANSAEDLFGRLPKGSGGPNTDSRKSEREKK